MKANICLIDMILHAVLAVIINSLLILAIPPFTTIMTTAFFSLMITSVARHINHESGDW